MADNKKTSKTKRSQVSAEKRETTRKLRKLREEGFVPAVVYDQKTNSDNIKIDAGDVHVLLQDSAENSIVDVKIDDKEKTAILKEIQKDPRTGDITHVSFMALNPKKEIDLEVEVRLVGEAPAVKNSVGVLILTNHELELRGLPKDMPNYLTIDISELEEIGDSLDATNIEIPDGVRFVREKDQRLTVATITPFQKEIEEEKEEEETAEGEIELEIEDGEEGAEPAEGEAGEEGEQGEGAKADQPDGEKKPEAGKQ